MVWTIEPGGCQWRLGAFQWIGIGDDKKAVYCNRNVLTENKTIDCCRGRGHLYGSVSVLYPFVWRLLDNINMIITSKQNINQWLSHPPMVGKSQLCCSIPHPPMTRQNQLCCSIPHVSKSFALLFTHRTDHRPQFIIWICQAGHINS